MTDKIKNEKSLFIKSTIKKYYSFFTFMLVFSYVMSSETTSTSSVDTSTNSTTIDAKTTAHALLIENITSLHHCYSNSDCSGNGVCDITTNSCECNEEFATYIHNYTLIVNNTQIQDLKLCNYSKKKQLTAFMLSLFVGFGSEHFYMDKNDVGIAKFVFYLSCYAGNIVLFIIYQWFPEKHHLIEFLGQYEAIYMTCGFITAILWVIYDLIKIGNMDYMDGKNIPLIAW